MKPRLSNAQTVRNYLVIVHTLVYTSEISLLFVRDLQKKKIKKTTKIHLGHTKI